MHDTNVAKTTTEACSSRGDANDLEWKEILHRSRIITG